MKKELWSKHLKKTISHFLIALAPIVLTQSACFLVWGEPDCPDCLKDINNI